MWVNPGIHNRLKPAIPKNSLGCLRVVGAGIWATASFFCFSQPLLPITEDIPQKSHFSPTQLSFLSRGSVTYPPQFSQEAASAILTILQGMGCQQQVIYILEQSDFRVFAAKGPEVLVQCLIKDSGGILEALRQARPSQLA